MALKYAPLCKVCGEVKTTHESGMCSHCRRKTQKGYICRICGSSVTKNENGLCYNCERSLGAKGKPYNVVADDVLEGLRQTIFIIERRKEGRAYSEIAKMLNIPKSVAFNREKQAFRSEMIFACGYDNVDGCVIPSAEDDARSNPDQILAAIPALRAISEQRKELQKAKEAAEENMDIDSGVITKTFVPKKAVASEKKEERE